MERLCPLKLVNDNYCCDCTETCAWYDMTNRTCAMLTIANRLDTISEVADGTRTLFVKEL